MSKLFAEMDEEERDFLMEDLKNKIKDELPSDLYGFVLVSGETRENNGYPSQYKTNMPNSLLIPLLRFIADQIEQSIIESN